MTAAAPAADGTLVAWTWQRPKGLIVLTSIVAIVLIGVVDAVTGPDLSVLTFYFLPVLFATWFVGRGAGMALSAGSAAEWIVIDLVANGGHITHGVSLWNTAIHVAFFIGGVWAVGELKESLEQHERAERQRIAHEFDTAREVQKALLPKEPDAQIRGFDVAASCEPALGISGDFYDFVAIDDERFLLALGDVSGKGISAGLLGASLLGGLRSLAPLYRGRVDELVGHLSTMLQKASPSVRYATLFAAEYDFASSRLRWVNAGHPSGLILHRSSAVPTSLDSSGTVVGLFPNVEWKQRESLLEPGDTLILFSDGLSEATDANGNEFGEERIAATVAELTTEPASIIHRALIEAVTRFTGGERLSDDRTLVVLRRDT